MVVPFRVEDADGGAATGSLYVPAAGSGLAVRASRTPLIKIKPGQKLDRQAGRLRHQPVGRPVSLTLKSRIWASPDDRRSTRR